MHHSINLQPLPFFLLFVLLLPILSQAASAADSPSTKLDDCGCWPIYQRMLNCQKIIDTGGNSERLLRSCVCTDASNWQGSVNGCTGCISPGSWKEDSFFDSVTQTVIRMLLICAGTGGGPRGPGTLFSDGGSICATNEEGVVCTALREGRKTGELSWASVEIFELGREWNATQLLDIAEYVEGLSG